MGFAPLAARLSWYGFWLPTGLAENSGGAKSPKGGISFFAARFSAAQGLGMIIGVIRNPLGLGVRSFGRPAERYRFLAHERLETAPRGPNPLPGRPHNFFLSRVTGPFHAFRMIIGVVGNSLGLGVRSSGRAADL